MRTGSCEGIVCESLEGVIIQLCPPSVLTESHWKFSNQDRCRQFSSDSTLNDCYVLSVLMSDYLDCI